MRFKPYRMKNTLSIISGILLVALSACGGSYDDDFYDDLEGYEPTYSVDIDNALDTTALVTITEKGTDSTMEYSVLGYGVETIQLEQKTYHITAKTMADSLFLDEDFTIDGSSYTYNLNLTKDDYIIERVTYIVSENPEMYKTNSSFTYNGKTYDEVDASVIKGALLVPSTWDYNLEDEMPEEVTIYGDQNKTTKTKLYRAETFLLYLELYELFGDMDLEDY